MSPMNYRFPVTVTDVFERKLSKHVSGHGPNAVFSSDSAGWYIQIDGINAIYVGAEKPEVKTGDKMLLKLEAL